MSFELFTRERVVTGVEAVTVTSMGRLAINKIATATLSKANAKFVQLLWDSDTGRVAIRPSGKVTGAYPLIYGVNGNGAGFSCVTFLNFIQYDWLATRNFPLTWDKDLGGYVFQIPSEHLGKPVPQGHLTRKSYVRKSRAKTPGVTEDTP